MLVGFHLPPSAHHSADRASFAPEQNLHTSNIVASQHLIVPGQKTTRPFLTYHPKTCLERGYPSCTRRLRVAPSTADSIPTTKRHRKTKITTQDQIHTHKITRRPQRTEHDTSATPVQNPGQASFLKAARTCVLRNNAMIPKTHPCPGFWTSISKQERG